MEISCLHCLHTLGLCTHLVPAHPPEETDGKRSSQQCYDDSTHAQQYDDVSCSERDTEVMNEVYSRSVRSERDTDVMDEWIQMPVTDRDW